MDLITTKSSEILVAISSMQNRVEDTSNSRITLGVSPNISTTTDQSYALVAISDFTFTNTLLNIPTSMIIPIKSYWYDDIDGTGPSINFAISEIVIPKGQYTQQSMLAYVNNNFPVFSAIPESGFITNTCYGLGLSPTFEAPVSIEPNNTKFVISQSSQALEQVYSGNGANPHRYSLFELICDSNNYRWFVAMGLKPIPNIAVRSYDLSPVSIDVSVNSVNYNGGTHETTVTYNIENEWVSPFAWDFSGVKMIYFYLDSPVSSHFRVPFDNCAESNVLGSICTAYASYGYQSTIQVQNLCFATQKNLTLSNLQISLRDEYNEYVNFQNIPWFATLRIKFAVSEDEPMVNALEGSVGTHNSLPSLHPTAQPYYNGAGRDILMGPQKKSKLGAR